MTARMAMMIMLADRRCCPVPTITVPPRDRTPATTTMIFYAPAPLRKKSARGADRADHMGRSHFTFPRNKRSQRRDEPIPAHRVSIAKKVAAGRVHRRGGHPVRGAGRQHRAPGLLRHDHGAACRAHLARSGGVADPVGQDVRRHLPRAAGRGARRRHLACRRCPRRDARQGCLQGLSHEALRPLRWTPEMPVFTTTEGKPIEPKAFASRY
jgi:hypothetical protein